MTDNSKGRRQVKPTTMTFEKSYSDDSGTEYAVKADSHKITFEHIGVVDFPLEELDWIIDALVKISHEFKS
jgi:hypothetical protein